MAVTFNRFNAVVDRGDGDFIACLEAVRVNEGFIGQRRGRGVAGDFDGSGRTQVAEGAMAKAQYAIQPGADTWVIIDKRRRHWRLFEEPQRVGDREIGN
ncbi:allantoate amidohydrolase [Pseudomonas syringae pv. spinaceae]|uniref:Allantoate amidohydrolase n=1 Tax=Pseudomonas syringae pv. spinaceae TaxID=264459 RepID=A0A0Q0AJS9_PSESX|nr:allantoate amidohydrolase [Pseudomonas syringae pv. spinaceae]